MAMRQHDAIRPKDRGEWTMFRQKRMDRRIKFIYPFDLAEHQGVEPWHRSPGLSHFEFYPLRSTQWNIVEVIRLYRKIQTIEFTLKISSRSQITRLCADLNPLSKTQKNQPFGENWERFYARWRERAREIPGAKIHPYNMLPSDADQIKAAKDG